MEKTCADENIEAPGEWEEDGPPEPSDSLFIELFWLLLFLTILTRLAWLTERPFHHDEAIHAYFSLPQHMGGYRYDPTYHAPFYHYVMYLFLYLFGDSDFVARLSAVFFGVLQIIAVRPLAGLLGRRIALFYGLLLLLSPLVTYYHRFMRMDAPMMAATIWFVVFAANYWREGDPWDLLWAFITAAVAFTTKENCYITAFIFAVFFLVAVLQRWERLERLGGLMRAQYLAWAAGLAVFFLIWVLCYTVFFKHPEDWNGFATAMKYWLGQHEKGRIANDWWFYLPRLGLYEFLTVASAAAALFSKRARRHPWFLFALVWSVGALAMYTWARERVPWLTVHILQPMALLAALGWGGLSLAGRRRKGLWLLGGIGVVLTLLTSYSLNLLYPAIGMNEKDPKKEHAEIGVYVQSNWDVERLADLVGERGEEWIFLTGEGTWPFSWRFRRANVNFGPTPDYSRDRVFIVGAGKEKEILKEARGRCVKSSFRLRSWWMPDPSELDAAKIWAYVTKRETSGIPVGNSNVTLIRCEEPCYDDEMEDPPPPLEEAESKVEEEDGEGGS